MGAFTKNPSGLAYNGAVPVYVKALAALAKGADLGNGTDPYVLAICPKPTRVLGGRLIARGTPAFDGSDTIACVLYAISAAGAVLGTICSHTVSAVPAAVSKLPPSINLNGTNNLSPTYYDIPAGGGIGISITQSSGANLWATAVVDVVLDLATADDSNASN